MPKKENVEQFREVLKQVAKEPEVLASRGMSSEDVQPPADGEPILPWEETAEVRVDLDDELDKLEKEESTAQPLPVLSTDEAPTEPELAETDTEEALLDEPVDTEELPRRSDIGLDDALDDLLGDLEVPETFNFGEDFPVESATEEESAPQSFEPTQEILENEPSTDNFLDEMDSLFAPSEDKDSELNLDDLLASDASAIDGEVVSPDYFSLSPSAQALLEEEGEDDLFSIDNKKEEAEDEIESFGGLDDVFSFDSGGDSDASSSFLEEEESGLSAEIYRQFYQKLLKLPKNLRLGVAEVIVKPELSEREVFDFVHMVIREKNYRKIARGAGTLLGKVIILPHSYYQAQEIARQQESLWYNVRTIAFPIFQKGLLLNVAVFLFLYLSFRFVLEPWQANSYFEEGLVAIEAGQSEDANALFRKAYHIRQWDDWFLTYANAYEDQRDYENATQKYEEMLTLEPFGLGAKGRTRSRFNHDGYLAYAELKTRQGLYKEADDLLQSVISENVQDYEGWLARGDNYMAWANTEPVRYSDALRSYASVIEIHGDSARPLFKLLNYYVKTDNEDESYRLYQYIESKSYETVDSPVYTAYASYLLDKDAQLNDYSKRKAEVYRVGKFSTGQEALVDREFAYIKNKDVFYLSDIGNLLRRSVESDPSYPSTYYYLSRYFKRSGNEDSARQAVEEAVKYFYHKKSLNPEENYLNVLSFKELGRSLESSQDYLAARQYYQRGIELYEKLLGLEILNPSRELAELFDLQGNSYYRVYEDAQAKFFFQKASQQGYSNPNMEYALANISYAEGNYPQMISYLFNIESTAGYRVDSSVLYSMGTALLDNQDQESAIGYYRQLLSVLQQRRGLVEEIDLDNPDHQELIERTIMTLNNLGVAELALANGMSGNHHFSEGMRHLAEAEELFDISTRQGVDSEKILEKDLASLNLQEGWQGGGELIRYQALPRYLEANVQV